MSKQSAGLLVFRRKGDVSEVLLAHPGGPFWARKDEGAWSIPKGEVNPGEDLEIAAKREFLEETNLLVTGKLLSLGSARLKSGKILHAWAIEADPELTPFASNSFEMEWPPRSGKKQAFPEIDRVQFFPLAEAQRRIHPSQAPFLERLRAPA